MKDDESIHDNLAALLRRAEKVRQQRPADFEALLVASTPRLVHELKVHRIELEIQNEELRLVQAARDKYAALYDFAPMGYFAIGEDGRIVEVNLTGAALLGVEKGLLLRKPFTRFVVSGDQDIYYKHRRQVFATRQRERCELKLSRSDSSQFFAQLESIVVQDDDSHYTLCWTFISDITERKQAEEALRKAKEEAEQASLSKSQFLAAACHDLRQPLQTISLLVALLSKPVKAPDTFKLTDNLNDALGTMEGLLNTLINVSKLEAGAVKPKISDFQVASLVDRMRSEFGKQAQQKGLALRIIPSNATVRSDPALLEQIVQNFLSNAIKYTRSGKVLLGCRGRGSMVRIEVWDTGIGIPTDQQQAIFEDFYQLDNPIHERSKGQGMGLAIVDRTARLLGYPIDVRSTLGRGSMFAVEVPMGCAACSSSDTPQTKPIVNGSVPSVPILLVEDDPAVLEATRLFLELSGFQVSTAMSGSEAMEHVKGEAVRPALIIADYRLPGGQTGLQVIDRIRATLGHEIRAIVLTGDSSPGMLREAKQIDCQFIHKPVNGGKLTTLIHQLLGATESQALPVMGSR